jgi:hypothetical protein
VFIALLSSGKLREKERPNSIKLAYSMFFAMSRQTIGG